MLLLAHCFAAGVLGIGDRVWVGAQSQCSTAGREGAGVREVGAVG